MTKAVDIGRFRKVTLGALPWDMGPQTAMQRAGKVVEPVVHLDPETGKRSNPNGVLRTRRERWVDRYLRQGRLTTGQYAVACELIDAAEGRAAQDPLASLRVDRSYGDVDPMAAHVDGRAKFRQMWALVPVSSQPVLDHVLVQDRSLRSMAGCIDGRTEARHLGRLLAGLDALIALWSAPKVQPS